MTDRVGQVQRTDLVVVMSLLDDALVGLRRVEDPDFPVGEVASYVAAALERVYTALANAGDYGAFRGYAAEALQLSRDALTALQFRPSADPAAMDDMRLVAQAVGLLSGSVSLPEAPPRLPRGESKPPLRASVGEPLLHDVQRTVLYPTVPIPERESVAPPAVDVDAPSAFPPPPVASAADLVALDAWAKAIETGSGATDEAAQSASTAPDGERVESVFGAASPAPQVIYSRAVSFFEDIAMMSVMRKPADAEVWHHLEPVERRMFARVDAILACGLWTVPRLVQLLDKRPIPDPELLWAALLVLGSIHGDDARDQIARLLRITPLDDPELFEAVSDALTFAPHRGIEGLMRRWLDEDSSEARALAIRVLGRRHATTAETLRPFLASHEPELVVETLRALEHVPGELDPSELRLALTDPRPAVFSAAAECAIARGYAMGAREAEARLRAGTVTPTAALLCAVTGDAQSLEPLLGAVATLAVPETYAAVGWYGSVKAVPFLLGRLRDGDEAAVIALQRLTGASLTDDEPMPEYAKEDRPFTRDRFIAPRFVLELSGDAERWAAWWRRYGEAADPGVRYRFGHRWSTRDDDYELHDAHTSPRDRRLAHLELCARTGTTLPFDPRELVVRQRAQLAALREYLGSEHARAPRGTWPVRFRR